MECRSAGVLPREDCISQLHQSGLPLNPRDKRLKAHWIITDKAVVN